MHPLERVDHLLEFRGQSADLIAQLGNQIVLNAKPSLQDQVASGSIHGVNVLVFSQTLHRARNGRPRPSILPNPAIKFFSTISFVSSSQLINSKD